MDDVELEVNKAQLKILFEGGELMRHHRDRGNVLTARDIGEDIRDLIANLDAHTARRLLMMAVMF